LNKKILEKIFQNSLKKSNKKYSRKIFKIHYLIFNEKYSRKNFQDLLFIVKNFHKNSNESLSSLAFSVFRIALFF